MLMRLTSDDQECIVRHLNIFFAENGKGYVRSGGADNQDIEEITWIREAAKNIGAELCSEDDEGLCDELYDNLQYGIEIPEGVIAYLYIAVHQAIEMRGRLKKVENILGDTYDLGRLRELVQADKEGRCVVLSTPMRSMVYKPNDTDVYCPRCGETLSGGWPLSDADDCRKLYQCPKCGQSIDDTKCEAAEKAVKEMEENENG